MHNAKHEWLQQAEDRAYQQQIDSVSWSVTTFLTQRSFWAIEVLWTRPHHHH